MVHGVCSDNGDVLPEVAIPADRRRHSRANRSHRTEDSATRWPGIKPSVRCHDSRWRTGGAREDLLEGK